MIPHWRPRALLAPLQIAFVALLEGSAAAQEAPGAPVDHTQHVNMAMGTGWQWMQDGVAFPGFNFQSGPRGGDEFAVPHWFMGMASRNTPRGLFTLTGMFSLEEGVHDKDGYRELFQSGETLDGAPLIDHQHPHDLFMQLAAAWRIPFSARTGLTIAGGPSGEPALGPVAFMHRPSAAEIPFAPLGHHTLDSTHVAFGVVTAAVDLGPWTAEASVFNGREPDENRWDFDFGRLDSSLGTRMVETRRSMGISGIRWASGGPGGARARQRRTDHGIGGVAGALERRLHRRHRRVGTQPDGPRQPLCHVWRVHPTQGDELIFQQSGTA